MYEGLKLSKKLGRARRPVEALNAVPGLDEALTRQTYHRQLGAGNSDIACHLYVPLYQGVPPGTPYFHGPVNAEMAQSTTKNPAAWLGLRRHPSCDSDRGSDLP